MTDIISLVLTEVGNSVWASYIVVPSSWLVYVSICLLQLIIIAIL